MKILLLINVIVLSSGYRLVFMPKIFKVNPFYQDSNEIIESQPLRTQRGVGDSNKLSTERILNTRPARDDGFSARFFNAFNNLNLDTIFPKKIQWTDFNNLLMRVTALEADAALGGGRRRGDQLAGQDMVPVEQVRQLLAELRPRCPITAAESQVIGDLCYSVEVKRVKFAVAAQICQAKGGILAEPSIASRQEFYTNIKNAYPTQIKEIESRQGSARNLFIGLRQPTTFSTTFEFLSCGVTVDAFDDNIFTPIPKIDFQVAQKAAIVPPGTMWQRVGSLLGNEKHSFICQYNTLI